MSSLSVKRVAPLKAFASLRHFSSKKIRYAFSLEIERVLQLDFDAYPYLK